MPFCSTITINISFHIPFFMHLLIALVTKVSVKNTKIYIFFTSPNLKETIYQAFLEILDKMNKIKKFCYFICLFLIYYSNENLYNILQQNLYKKLSTTYLRNKIFNRMASHKNAKIKYSENYKISSYH